MANKNTIPYERYWNFDNSRPFAHCSFFAFVFQYYVVSFVVRLLQSCRPTTIIWCIMSFVINSIQRMLFRRTLTHIFKKIDKTRWALPTEADLDAPASVIVVAFIIFVVASIQHATPCVECYRFGHSVGFVGRDVVKTKAPTAFGFASSKIAGVHENLFSTITLTQPFDRFSFSCFSLSDSYNQQPSESFPCNVIKCGHDRPPLEEYFMCIFAGGNSGVYATST